MSRRKIQYKRVPGHPQYAVSNDGRLWNTKTGRRLRGHKNKSGYIIVQLAGGKRYGMHQLVLLAFAGPCPKGMHSRHFPDRTRHNNHVSNLQWDTPTANNLDKTIHGTMTRGTKVNTAKLTEEQVLKARRFMRTKNKKRGAIGRYARRIGISPRTLVSIHKRKSWKWL